MWSSGRAIRKFSFKRSDMSTERFVLDFQSNSATTPRTAMAVRIERITLV
jgi:hypothetical protein